MTLTMSPRSTAMSPSQGNNDQHHGIQVMSLKSLGTTLPQTEIFLLIIARVVVFSKYKITIFFQFLGT